MKGDVNIKNCRAVHRRCKTHAAPFLFWLFSCRKWSRSLTKTNKYFIQCIMCAVWSTREKEKKRASSGVHMLWIPNDTSVNVTGTVAQRGNAQGCYTMESSIYFNTAFPFLVSAPLSLFTVPISLSYSHRIMPPTHTHRRRKDASPILRARYNMRSLFSGCAVPEVAILLWPPLLFSKPCNQCIVLCTRMSQDTPP